MLLARWKNKLLVQTDQFFTTKIYFAASLMLICIDFLTKRTALNGNNFVINQGFSFGIFSNNQWQIFLTVGLLIMIIYLNYQQKILGRQGDKFPDKYFPDASMMMLISAGIANLLDRVLYGGVIDWLPLAFGMRNNLADWYIFFAMAIFFFRLQRLQQTAKPRSKRI